MKEPPMRTLLQTSARPLTGTRIASNILHSVLAKGVNLACVLLTMPMGLQYLGRSDYGIWLTIFSVISWVSFFDLGISNGLKNRIAGALATNDIRTAGRYLSTAYALLFLIVSALFILSWGIFSMMPAVGLLSVPPDPRVTAILLLLAAIQALRLLTEPVLALLAADHHVGLAGWITSVGNILSLAAVYAVVHLTRADIRWMGLASTLPQLVVLVAASACLYGNRYRKLAPALSAIDTRLSRDLLSLGGGFFILQLSALVLFSTDNLIILKLFSAEEVVPYNISFRYFSLLSVLFSLFLSPFWPAFTSYHATGDIGRIRLAMRRLLLAWALTALAGALMLPLAPLAYRLWLGHELPVPAQMDLCMLLFAVISSWNNLFAAFLNGLSMIRLQVYVSVICAIVNIPLSVLLASHAGIGPSGVMLATCICLLAGSVFAPVQYLRIMKGTAAGIWKG